MNITEWVALKHPAYSQDISTRDFHVLGKLMKVLKGIHIGSQCVGGRGSGLGSSSRHSLQMGYTNLRINGTPV